MGIKVLVVVLGWLLIAPALVAGEAVEEVVIQDFKFQPAEITVKVGATVRWVNREKRQYHSVWFQSSGDPEPPYFFPEESYERTFDKPGSFDYRCGPHEYMRGIVKVVE